ncbi:unnamed protein product [Polarella glacialis]|uniref:Major facilitator superfamily associated domain-containing protein n=1 Tax=Polarella glacialis TaxID=89957 RepID=A0A813E1E5_POLGL|nr:unnamed protein product [Polarella glacialis]
MGYGTGVLRIFYLVSWMRGMSSGIMATTALDISLRSGIPQPLLVAARGVGLTFSPVIFGKGIGRMVWSGESQSGFALFISIKVVCELVVPRTNSVPLLYLGYGFIGVAMAALDTSASVLVARVHGKDCGRVLLAYCAAYGVGCLMSSWFCVYLGPFHAWDVLAVSDFLMTATLICSRFGKGKPQDWKAKIRKVEVSDPAPGNDQSQIQSQKSGAAKAEQKTPQQEQQERLLQQVQKVQHEQQQVGPARVPGRILRAANAFMFITEAIETSVSAWCFSYGLQELGMTKSRAALLPTAFYFSFTGVRFALAPLTRFMLPSAVMQIGTLIAFIGAAMFAATAHFLVALLKGGATMDELSGFWLYMLIASISLMGAGFSPQCAMVQAAVREHGEMTSQEAGYFFTACSLGILAGLFLPGVMALPFLDLLGGLALVAISVACYRDFPLTKPQGVANGRAVVAQVRA